MSLFAALFSSPSKKTDINTGYGPGFPHWPRVLDYPPAANVATQTLIKYVKLSADPASFAKFKAFLQAKQIAGQDTVEIVSREVFEIAKSHLGALHGKLYHTIEVMQGSAHLTGLGAALIVIGALGIYLTQPTPVETEAPKRSWTQLFSYGAMATGLALVAFATYRLQSNVNLLMKNFEVVFLDTQR
jgi:hypothetical protein